MDCPWCGYGWFFLCPKCRKAFTFAKAVEVDLTWEELAHKDLDGKWGRQPTAEEIREWIGFMKILLKGLQLGKQHVYIDGWVFRRIFVILPSKSGIHPINSRALLRFQIVKAARTLT